MKFYISYFFQVRNLKYNMVPFSTAVWDPKWFHDGFDPNHVFFDKRGICNGLRISELAPGPICSDKCRGPASCEQKPTTCDFLRLYAEQLSHLDFDKCIQRIEAGCLEVQKRVKFRLEPIPVLLVYEKPDNPCSERHSLVRWFAEHSVTLNSWPAV